MYPLIRNECLKIWKKKRYLVIVLILLILIPLFTYAQFRVAENTRKQTGTIDWHVSQTQRVNDIQNRLTSSRIPDEWKKNMRIELQRVQFYLDKNIDPQSPNGVTFARDFLSSALTLFLPLMVLVMASDLVSGEHSTGTIKLLLTRPVNRWRILLSKLVALMLYVSLLIFTTILFCYLISGSIFGYSGWSLPVLTGFQIVGSDANTDLVHPVTQFQYMIMESGLVWFSLMVVAVMSLMVSILVRSTAAGMGIMLATIIAGTILTSLVSSWETAKYLFMVNLQLTTYLAGTLPPIRGMTLAFSLSVLSVWTLVSLIISFRVFIKQDIMN